MYNGLFTYLFIYLFIYLLFPVFAKTLYITAISFSLPTYVDEINSERFP